MEKVNEIRNKSMNEILDNCLLKILEYKHDKYLLKK